MMDKLKLILIQDTKIQVFCYWNNNIEHRFNLLL